MTRDELVLEAHSRLRTLPFRYRGGSGPGANGRLHDFGDRVIIKRVLYRRYEVPGQWAVYGTHDTGSTAMIDGETRKRWAFEVLDTLADVVQWAKTNGMSSDEYGIEPERGVWLLHDGKLSRFYRWDLVDPDWLEAHMMGGSRGVK